MPQLSADGFRSKTITGTASFELPAPTFKALPVSTAPPVRTAGTPPGPPEANGKPTTGAVKLMKKYGLLPRSGNVEASQIPKLLRQVNRPPKPTRGPIPSSIRKYFGK